jgi:hypothetical protein
MTGQRFTLAFAVVAALTMTAGGARADVIDGEWCHTDGRHFSIKGPEIITPFGTRTKGNYTRHYFSYVVPPSDKPAGETVSMTLVNENTVNLRLGTGAVSGSSTTANAVEVWRRCTPAVSALPEMQIRS